MSPEGKSSFASRVGNRIIGRQAYREAQPNKIKAVSKAAAQVLLPITSECFETMTRISKHGETRSEKAETVLAVASGLATITDILPILIAPIVSKLAQVQLDIPTAFALTLATKIIYNAYASIGRELSR